MSRTSVPPAAGPPGGSSEDSTRVGAAAVPIAQSPYAQRAGVGVGPAAEGRGVGHLHRRRVPREREQLL